MAAATEWLDMCPDTVKVAPFSSKNNHGEASYGADVSYRARIQHKAQMVRTATGDERVSTTQVYLVTTDAITARDRVTLPSGFAPNQPPILNVYRARDEKSAHHVVLYC